jgi:hypothetical protein
MKLGAKGKYTKQNLKNPKGLGTCDYSGLIMRHCDMVKQYQYAGNTLVWTGLWVNPVFKDTPNPQDLIPILKLDPVALKHARPDANIYNNETTITTIDVTGLVDSTLLTTSQLEVNVIQFTGTLTDDLIIFIPNIYTEFYANNYTVGNYQLSIQLKNNPYGGLLIPNISNGATGPLVSNNTLTLQFINYPIDPRG